MSRPPRVYCLYDKIFSNTDLAQNADHVTAIERSAVNKLHVNLHESCYECRVSSNKTISPKRARQWMNSAPGTEICKLLGLRRTNNFRQGHYL